MKIQFVFAAPKVMPKLGEMGEKVAPPMGILYLAAYLREKITGLDIRAIDGPNKGFDYTLNEIKAFNPNVLCVSYYTVSALGAYELINVMKKEIPHLFVIVGGHHVTAMPGEALSKSKADLEVYYEGEVTLAEIISKYLENRMLDFSSIQGIGYLENGELKTTAPRPFIEDINVIPFPARDLINMSDHYCPVKKQATCI